MTNTKTTSLFFALLLIGLLGNPYSFNPLASDPIVTKAHAQSTQLINVERGDTYQKLYHADNTVIHTFGLPELIEHNGKLVTSYLTEDNDTWNIHARTPFEIEKSNCDLVYLDSDNQFLASTQYIPQFSNDDLTYYNIPSNIIPEFINGNGTTVPAHVVPATCDLSYTSNGIDDTYTITKTVGDIVLKIPITVYQDKQVEIETFPEIYDLVKDDQYLQIKESLTSLASNVVETSIDQDVFEKVNDGDKKVKKKDKDDNEIVQTEFNQSGETIQNPKIILKYSNGKELKIDSNKAKSHLQEVKVKHANDKHGNPTLVIEQEFTDGVKKNKLNKMKYDPVFGGTLSASGRSYDTSGTGNCDTRTGGADDGSKRGEKANGGTGCQVPYFEFTNLSTIPNGSIVSAVDIGNNISFVSNMNFDCVWREIARQPSVETSANIYSDSLTGTSVTVSNSDCQSTGTYTHTMNAAGIASIQSIVDSSTDWYAISSFGDTMTTDATVRDFRYEGTDTTLTVTYIAPVAPLSPINNSVTNSTGSLTYDWTFDTNYDNSTQPAISTSTVYIADSDVGIFSFLTNVTSPTSSYVHGSLAGNTQKCVKISAWNSIGESTNSSIRCGLTLSPTPTVTGLTVIPDSISQITLDWADALSFDNILGFRIFIESPTGNGWTLHTNDTGTTTSFLVDTGLSTKTQYNYMVAGINATGVGSNSTAAAAITYGVPDAITDLSLGSTSTSITLSWSAPTIYGYAITGYKIEYETPIGNGWSTLVSDTGDTLTTYEHTGLTTFTQYNYRVSAITSFGNSVSSNEAAAYTVTDAPVLDVVNDCYHTCTTQLNLEFTAPIGTITGYKIEHDLNGAGYAVLVANTTNTNVTYNATGLSTGDIVSYRVSAHSEFGTSAASNEVEYSTHDLPDEVDDLVATETSLSSIDLEWTLPDINSHILNCWNINYTTPIGEPQTIITSCSSTTDLEYEITGLALGAPNSFRVSAVTPHGNNAAGNIVNATAFSEFEIGTLEITASNNNDVVDVRFARADSGDDATVTVIYPDNVTDFRCDLDYQNAGTNQTYTGLTANVYDGDYSYSEFILNDVANDAIEFYCWDAPNPTVNGNYLISQSSFPLIDQANAFRDNTFGTSGEFGGLDLITLIVIIVSMVGFNRTNAAAGILISVMILGATSYFGLIAIPTMVMSALVLVVMLAIVITRRS